MSARRCISGGIAERAKFYPSSIAQLLGTAMGIAIAGIGGWIVYRLLKTTVGLRLDPEQEFDGADLSIHRISATPERETTFQ